MKVFVFIALKIAEIGGSISILWAFAKLGEIYNAFFGLRMNPAWFCNLLVGMFTTFLTFLVIGLVGQAVFWIIQENLKLANQITRR